MNAFYRNKKVLQKYAYIISVIVVAVSAFFLGKEQGISSMQRFVTEFRPLRVSSEDSVYTSPLIGVESPEATEVGIYDDLKESVEDIIKDAKKNNKAQGVSVYFRDLSTSLWFGIDKEEAFYPASLLKLPYAFAGFKVLESNPELARKRYVYTEEIAAINKNRPAASPSALVVGNGYTIEELIIFMLEHSDNGARDMLAIFIPKTEVDRIFSVTGINLPSPSSEYEITTERYARFLRMLYSASYINEANSNKVLNLLTKTDFDFALTKELPKPIEVAHKWGVVNMSVTREGVALSQLHDCGIVYNGDDPYVLCMMTKGEDQIELASVMGEISKTIFDYMENKK